MIGIIDYGAGNLQSVKNAFDKIGVQCEIITNAESFEHCSGLILPGVGSFGEAMIQLNKHELVEPIVSYCNNNKPLLGICLGLQLLFEYSEESPNVKGLSIFNGGFKRLPDFGLKIPQIGWNDLKILKKDGIFENTSTGDYAYFVHSYYLDTAEDIIAATVNYGVEITIAVERQNISACQFHPEKSGEIGLRMLQAFAKRCGEECSC
ncbi:MAG: imidazole glycerol phosphate synthase subunit HisH [Oscillospiraceae bacterium]|nr:imidazole glycerol phosphate synthase subunit HisH [Oscillospiraceae bacterium]